MHSEILLIEIANKVMLHKCQNITKEKVQEISNSNYSVTLTDEEVEHILFLIDRIL